MISYGVIILRLLLPSFVFFSSLQSFPAYILPSIFSFKTLTFPPSSTPLLNPGPTLPVPLPHAPFHTGPHGFLLLISEKSVNSAGWLLTVSHILGKKRFLVCSWSRCHVIQSPLSISGGFISSRTPKGTQIRRCSGPLCKMQNICI